MSIMYALEPKLTAQEFQSVLRASGLAARRPAEDLPRLDEMLRHADIIATARVDGRLIGVSRAITDYAYCCYLSDLAVDAAHQRQGIGKQLIANTHSAAGPRTTLLLVAPPAALQYYPQLGMRDYPCFGIPREG